MRGATAGTPSAQDAAGGNYRRPPISAAIANDLPHKSSGGEATIAVREREEICACSQRVEQPLALTAADSDVAAAAGSAKKQKR